MVRLYTGGGDQGTTRLWDGQKVSKYDPRIELNGTLDEASANIGLARALGPASMQDELKKLQKMLQDLMAYVARGRREAKRPDPAVLEEWIDAILEDYPMKGEFVLPGDSKAGGALHVARAVTRRAERVALPLWDGEGLIDAEAYKFINRLSDLLYALAHKADIEAQVERIVQMVSDADKKSNPVPEPVRNIALDEALVIIEAAKAQAELIKIPMVVAVCSNDGAMIAFQRMPGSLPVSVQIAEKKAGTALKLKMDTEDLTPLVQPGAPLYGLNSDPSLVTFGGGKLLKRNGVVVGSVGVSGGSPEEDMCVAAAAVKKFEAL